MRGVLNTVSELVGWLQWRMAPVGRASTSFRSTRHFYYTYLAELLADTRGKKTMLDIFRRDAQRYEGTPRGVLTQLWSRKHEDGAGLVETWQGTLPATDLLVLGAAESAGGAGAIEAALADVARLAKRDTDSKSQFFSTILVGLFAVSLALGVSIGLPIYFVPLLKQSFSFVPLEMWGSHGQRLLAFSAWVDAWWPMLIAAVVGAGMGATLALPRWADSPRRAWLDRHFLPYRLYRDARAAEFVATLASVLKRRGNVSMNMREGLELIRARSTPWLAAHCTKMIMRLDHQTEEGAGALDTGLFSRESVFYMSDVMETLGPDEGLQVAGLRLETQIAETIARSAFWLRTVLVVSGVAVLFGMSAWMFLCLGELKTATALVFSR